MPTERRDVLNALRRVADRLEQERDAILAADPSDVAAEFPAVDAELVRAAIEAIEGAAPLVVGDVGRVDFDLPCDVRTGVSTYGVGVPASRLFKALRSMAGLDP